MAIKREIDLLEKYCEGRGANIGCGNRLIGNSINVDCRKTSITDIVCDGAKLPFKDGELDYIVSSHCLEHIDRGPVAVLREWARCVRKGGIIALIVPDGEQEGLLALKIDANTPGEHLHVFTMRTLEDLFEFVGLAVMDIAQIDRMPERPQRTILIMGVKI